MTLEGSVLDDLELLWVLYAVNSSQGISCINMKLVPSVLEAVSGH
jgi:hypothetical protein